ncbi:hypothetical protein MUCCIDRAFT_153013 [Mucor lusitanicus CBS 277.49]|uniref:ubiquitinyl hydrolase 1 n=1 Tax=Mucor lusitanicus CBS 277.49 TaxID=747725 RepID=A0A168LKV8_MUCCL|nr:hypothetical protein MUCCIDRAFT_153013 [Mucor lusitanicus CBS 277.49]
MNSALQCLSNTPQLTRYFLSEEYRQHINTSNALGLNGDLAEAYAKLLRDIWISSSYSSRRVVESISPGNFKSTFERFNPHFVGYSQQDSQELLGFLLDGLHEDLNRVHHKPYIEIPDFDDHIKNEEIADMFWSYHKSRNDSIIVDLFQGQYKSRLVCGECKKVSITFDPFMYMSLPLPVDNNNTDSRVLTLSDCLDEFTGDEHLDDQDSWFCPRCKKHQRALKKMDIWKLPEIMVVHLKRFSQFKHWGNKVNTMIDFPLKGLDMTDRVLGHQDESLIYDLYAVDNHYGGIGGGHYTAFAQNIDDGHWYEFNDSSVTAMSAKDAKTSAAYLLFYKRRS